MKIKSFQEVSKQERLREEYLWRYCYHAGVLKKIMVKQIY